MCNVLHMPYKRIKKSGVGYKIFAFYPKLKRTRYRPMYGYRGDGVYFKEKEINKFDSQSPIYGFCFFLTKQEAQSYLYGSGKKHRSIRKIIYSDGLGKMKHGDFNFCLCREFKILRP